MAAVAGAERSGDDLRGDGAGSPTCGGALDPRHESPDKANPVSQLPVDSVNSRVNNRFYGLLNSREQHGDRCLATRVAYKGSQKTVEFLCDEEGMGEVRDFVDSLGKADRVKVDALVEMLAERGRISNVEKFKKLEETDGIFELKSFQIRLLGFWAPGNRFIVCRGVKKKRDKHNPADIEFAEKCKKKFTGGG